MRGSEAIAFLRRTQEVEISKVRKTDCVIITIAELSSSIMNDIDTCLLKGAAVAMQIDTGNKIHDRIIKDSCMRILTEWHGDRLYVDKKETKRIGAEFWRLKTEKEDKKKHPS